MDNLSSLWEEQLTLRVYLLESPGVGRAKDTVTNKWRKGSGLGGRTPDPSMAWYRPTSPVKGGLAWV